jgi:uncharacterized protein with HEPN domain
VEPGRPLLVVFVSSDGLKSRVKEKDQKTYDAVERCLERISEAAAKPGDLAASLVPGQPSKEIRALGNRLRHECDAIREDGLWDIVQVDLPTLSAACAEALQRLRAGQTGQ